MPRRLPATNVVGADGVLGGLELWMQELQIDPGKDDHSCTEKPMGSEDTGAPRTPGSLSVAGPWLAGRRQALTGTPFTLLLPEHSWRVGMADDTAGER